MKNILNFLNESHGEGLRNFVASDKSDYGKLTNDDLNALETIIKNNIILANKIKINFPGLNEDLIKDIAGYILEAYLYDITTKAIGNYLHNPQNTQFASLVAKMGNKLEGTGLAGRGLKDNDKKSIYWDFSFNGLDEKFEIKTICQNGKHQGGLTVTKDQKSDTKLIYITCKYEATANSINIDPETVTIKRTYKR